jgi:hypothetical protein
MSKTQIPVYATSEDWRHLLTSVSSQRPLKLVKAGLFATAAAGAADVLDDLDKIEPFAGYLVLAGMDQISPRRIPQRGGDPKYAVDQISNPDSIILNVGGMASQDCLVAGQVGTARTEQAAQELHALFEKAIKKQFVRIKSYYVAPLALQLLDSGARLTPTRNSPQAYDLVR